jgi:hypothetical protein
MPNPRYSLFVDEATPEAPRHITLDDARSVLLGLAELTPDKVTPDRLFTPGGDYSLVGCTLTLLVPHHTWLPTHPDVSPRMVFEVFESEGLITFHPLALTFLAAAHNWEHAGLSWGDTARETVQSLQEARL